MPDQKAFSATDYLALLQSLLPPGPAWTRRPDAVLTRLLAAAAEEMARVDSATHNLHADINPAETFAVEEWERVLDLPDSCLPAGASFQERRAFHT